MQQIIIKKQNNFSSMGRSYAKRNFVPIEHEYIMVLKKLLPYMIDFQLPTDYKMDIRNSEDATWKDVVYAVMKKLGKAATLQEIYDEIAPYKKCKNNKHWKEKVRQTLNQSKNTYHSEKRGMWAVAM